MPNSRIVTDADASMDLLIPVCNGADCSLLFLFNKQRSFCERDGEKGCRGTEKFCVKQESYGFEPPTTPSDFYRIIKMSDIMPSEVRGLKLMDKSRDVEIPIQVAVGRICPASLLILA